MNKILEFSGVFLILLETTCIRIVLSEHKFEFQHQYLARKILPYVIA